MEAYAPTSLFSVLVVAAALLGALATGCVVSRLPRRSVARAMAWAVVASGVLLVDRVTAAEPSGFRMVALCSVTLLTMKGVVVVEARVALSPARWLAFALLWVGMNPRPFAGPSVRPLQGARGLVLRGLARMAIGGALAAAARAMGPERRVVGVLLMMGGLGLLFHFGLFTVMAGLWRRVGVSCDAICQAPELSRSLSEFWGRRWNRAFSEMCSIGLYRPLTPLMGRTAAMLAVFLFSGLLHEVAISLPVRAGFGLPTLYFALHGAVMWVERARGWTCPGRAWTLFWVLGPTPLLFHPAFLAGVVVPILE